MSVSERRSYLRAADRRDHILDCALEAFAKNGFHDTSIADICALAHIGRGTLYEYFHDKRAVLAALLDRIANGVIDAVRAWVPFDPPADVRWTAQDNVAFVEARCHLIMQVVFADGDTSSLILRMARGSGSVRTALARIDAQVVGAIAADVRTGIERGILRSIDPDVIAQFIVGGIEKIVFDALEHGRTVDVSRVAREIAVLLSSGLLAGEHAAVVAPPPGSHAERSIGIEG